MTSYLVAVVGHQALLADRLPSYVEVLEEAGFALVAQQHCLLEVDQARALLNNGVDNDQDTFTPDAPVCAMHLSSTHDDAYRVFDSVREALDFSVYGSKSNWLALRDEALFFPSQHYLERTLIVLKPHYSDFLYQSLHNRIDSVNHTIIAKQAKILSVEEARILTNNKDEIDVYTSDISMLLVVEGLNAINHWTLLLGPTDPVVARECDCSTLRALHGETAINNAIYNSPSLSLAERDISSFFPQPFPLERTLAIVKPEGRSRAKAVYSELTKYGFTVLSSTSVVISRAQAETIYNNHAGMPYYELLITSLTQGRSLVLALTKPKAIERLTRLIGQYSYSMYLDSPMSLPSQSLQSLAGDDVINNGIVGVEDSGKLTAALKDFFPNLINDSFVSDDSQQPTLQPGSVLQSVLVEGLTALCKAKPANDAAVEWLAQWLLGNNPNKPRITEPEDEPVKEKKPLRAVWLPSTTIDWETEQLALTSGYQSIDVRSLIADATYNNKDYGAIIAEANADHRPIPTNIIIALLDAAISAATTNKILIMNFPLNLEMAFEFESVIGKPAAVISAVNDKLSDEQQAVNDHYRVFNKLVYSGSSKVFV